MSDESDRALGLYLNENNLTRPRIVDALETIALRLANAPDAPPAGWAVHEWAYVKGIAAAAILRLRDDLARVPTP